MLAFLDFHGPVTRCAAMSTPNGSDHEWVAGDSVGRRSRPRLRLAGRPLAGRRGSRRRQPGRCLDRQDHPSGDFEPVAVLDWKMGRATGLASIDLAWTYFFSTRFFEDLTEQDGNARHAEFMRTAEGRIATKCSPDTPRGICAGPRADAAVRHAIVMDRITRRQIDSSKWSCSTTSTMRSSTSSDGGRDDRRHLSGQVVTALASPTRDDGARPRRPASRASSQRRYHLAPSSPA